MSERLSIYGFAVVMVAFTVADAVLLWRWVA